MLFTIRESSFCYFLKSAFFADNTVPEITFPETFVKTNSNPEISWRSSENAQFECSLDGGDFEGCGSGLSNRWSRDNLPDGKHTFSVRGRDRNGNVGEVQTIEWTVGRKALSFTSCVFIVESQLLV